MLDKNVLYETGFVLLQSKIIIKEINRFFTIIVIHRPDDNKNYACHRKVFNNKYFKFNLLKGNRKLISRVSLY